MSHLITDGLVAREFVLAGNARFTLRSKISGTRFTYRVKQPNPNTPHFVQVLNGPDNNNSFRFIGTIFSNLRFKYGDRSGLLTTAPCLKAFGWAWDRLARGMVPSNLEFWTENRCARCGRVLTVPDSIQESYGPECSKRKSNE